MGGAAEWMDITTVQSEKPSPGNSSDESVRPLITQKILNAWDTLRGQFPNYEIPSHIEMLAKSSKRRRVNKKLGVKSHSPTTIHFQNSVSTTLSAA